MAKKFNIEQYRSEINEKINVLTAKVNELEKDRYNKYWEIRDIKDEIADLETRRDPKFMCELCYSDRHAYEIIRIETEKRMVIRRLIAKRVNVGEFYMSDCQDYEFESDTNAVEYTVRLHKDGFFYATNNCNPFRITNEPHEYFDYSF